MASTRPFEGKVIAITGGASGIGLATAHYLAARGAALSLADITQQNLDSASSAIQKEHSGAKVLTAVVDVRKPPQINEWIQTTVKELGKLDGAVNLAGVIPKSIGIKPVGEVDDEEWDFVLGVNLTGVFYCMRAEVNAMEDGGSVVNAASIAGLIGFARNASYTASKHGVVGLTRAAAKEYGAERGIRVNCICPGMIETPMVAQSTETRGENALAGSIMTRKGEPREVAALIAYLLGDESKFTTGSAVQIDGGWAC